MMGHTRGRDIMEYYYDHVYLGRRWFGLIACSLLLATSTSNAKEQFYFLVSLINMLKRWAEKSV